jgi:hypothetical protein
MSARKGCLAGCAVALGLVLLYPLVLIAQIVIPLTLGLLFPWEPPVAEDAPKEAVLRVLVPEGETYRIEWGTGFEKKTEEGDVQDPHTRYRDHAVPDEAVDRQGRIIATIYVGIDRYNPAGNNDVAVGAVLFVMGEYADCEGGNGYIFIRWAPHQELDTGTLRATCGSHRYAPL